jgi:hypothetical protein
MRASDKSFKARPNSGLIGPMWDGDAIRYECSATYAELSA